VPSNLHIEHIMPQAWHMNWPLTGDDIEERTAHRDRAIHTIGNLTLVNNRLNSSLSNAHWGKKREVLADFSVLFLNKHLVHNGPLMWNENEIEKRANLLHNEAIKVWPHYSDISESHNSKE